MTFGFLRRFEPTGGDGKSWPVFLLLLVVVLLPSLGVLGFMDQAMRNERLAIRQKLSDVYRTRLAEIRDRLEGHWQGRLASLAVASPERPAPERFAALVRSGEWPLASVVLRGEDPYPPASRVTLPAPPARGVWRDAERLEHGGDFDRAIALYSRLAAEEVAPNLRARAILGRARALARSGEPQQAVRLIIEELAAPELQDAVDHQGRLIVPSAQLRALQLMGDRSDPLFLAIARLLRSRLADYRAAMPASQRLFLMQELEELLGPGDVRTRTDSPSLEGPLFDTLAAEALARQYLEQVPAGSAGDRLRPSDLPGIWHAAAAGGDLVVLLQHEDLRRDLDRFLAAQPRPEGTAVDLLEPGQALDEAFFVTEPAGPWLPGWQIALRPSEQSLFAASAHQRIRAYLLIGSLVVLAMVLLAVLVVRLVSRQLRLTRLKDDLLSTVSHELKTPLASIRLLVDTLLATGGQDPVRDREYLELVAQENLRLSRLIESFLTFSRLERDDSPLEKRPTDLKQVAETAASALEERLKLSPDGPYRLDIEIAEDLPRIDADPDALVTVITNLLENAYKYSPEEKVIQLHGFLRNGDVCLAVQDRGIGLSKAEARHIFERFYQVDRSLARSDSGCGLGLAIVERLVKAHGGKVDVESRPGQGSTFTVRLPSPPEEPSQQEMHDGR